MMTEKGPAPKASGKHPVNSAQVCMGKEWALMLQDINQHRIKNRDNGLRDGTN